MPIGEAVTVQKYSDSYKNDLFLLWWKNQKPAVKRLWQMIPEDWDGDKPVVGTIERWIREIFVSRAKRLDAELAREIEGRLVKEKVEMLHRHAEVGRKIQKQALDCLDSIDPSKLSSSSAVRLLVEGVRIERDSVGLPQALEKIINADDEELFNRIQKLTKESQAEILVDDNEPY